MLCCCVFWEGAEDLKGRRDRGGWGRPCSKRRQVDDVRMSDAAIAAFAFEWNGRCPAWSASSRPGRRNGRATSDRHSRQSALTNRYATTSKSATPTIKWSKIVQPGAAQGHHKLSTHHKPSPSPQTVPISSSFPSRRAASCTAEELVLLPGRRPGRVQPPLGSPEGARPAPIQTVKGTISARP